MKLLLAVDHAEIQKFIAQDHRVEALQAVNSVKELYEALKHTKADTIVVSRYLKGNDNPRQLVEYIMSIRPELRIVYLYGREDEGTQMFIKYLESKNITDYHVGVKITSQDINRILFGEEARSHGGIRNLFRKSVKTRWIRELDTAVITIYSNCSNGKSHFAWNLASVLAKRGYKTTLINMDRGYSANLYFGIPDMYFDLLDYLIEQKEHKNILDCCYKKGNLQVVTGRLGNDTHIDCEDFLKFLYFARTKSDIVIIDTYSGLNDITFQSINNSTIDFLIFDCDLMHFHMNKLMLEKLGSDFVEDKTFAIINNYVPGSEAYKYIYRQINKLSNKFKGILPLGSCGSLGCELMHTDKTSYEAAKGSSFRADMDNILKAINVRNPRNNIKYFFERR